MNKFLFFVCLSFMFVNLYSQPISLCNENPKYFFYKDKPTVLVASTEHYGAVINPDFDFEKYLATLKGIGLNHTRIWLGDYVEIPGDFCMSVNTSAPLPGKFIAPWARSGETGYAAGGNKFNLDKWNPVFFERLHAFMKQASDNNIVVECVLFFVGPNWKYLPMNPSNNINNTSEIDGQDYLTLNNGNILDYQKKYCLKLITELNQYDNVIFNIVNEPWFINPEHEGFCSPADDKTKEWIYQVSEWIVQAEKNMDKKHILSVDYMNEGRIIKQEEIDEYWKNISVFNHHYDKNASSAILNYDVKRVMSFNETGLMPQSTDEYRIQGWKYLMSGGALYDNLDFTFQVGYEDGTGSTDFVCDGYNGCNDQSVKYEMAVLLNFMKSIDIVNLRPNYNVIGVGFGDKDYCVLENPGKEYVIYIYGKTNQGSLLLNLTDGNFHFHFLNPSDGKTILEFEKATDSNGHVRISLPEFKDDLAIVIKRFE